MAIRAERIRADIEAIARCTATPGSGATRPTFSAAWAQARDYVMAHAVAAGCTTRIDPAGNVFARPTSIDPGRKTWLVGSHIDTVPHGGDYDGVAGIVVALELLRSAGDDATAPLPVELVIFAEEEGPTFGVGMLGSRTLVGDLTAQDLAQLRNADGASYVCAGALYGVIPGAIGTGQLQRDRHLGLVELHIEQGPGMWRRGQRLAVVTAIAGRRQYRITLQGEANHAGATAMADRSDALVGAAEMMLALERLAPELSDTSVITVGHIDNRPNAINVIPDRVEFTIDFRDADQVTLDRGDCLIRERLARIASIRGLSLDTAVTESIPARPMSAVLVDRLRAAGRAAGFGDLPPAVSGALHDSAVIAPHLPTVMLFVPSRDGVSHNPAEFSRIEDLAAGAAVIERMVRTPTLAQLNLADRPAFVSVCGPLFEHSPWIAERAWDRRPFASLAALHAAMMKIVNDASDDAKLTLIRSHPDLVGRLARAGRLTRESTGEQAAAGLDALSPDEIDSFERLNTAYHDKFGFPFVICARLNRKNAILDAFPRRLANDRETEITVALQEIGKIAELRLRDAVWESP